MGLRWRQLESGELSWRDLLVIVNNLPRTSALFRSQFGAEEYLWGPQEQLLASISDTLDLLLWIETDDAQRKPPRNRPKPTPRPGVVDESARTIGSGALEVGAMKEWLGGDFILQAS